MGRGSSIDVIIDGRRRWEIKYLRTRQNSWGLMTARLVVDTGGFSIKSRIIKNIRILLGQKKETAMDIWCFTDSGLRYLRGLARN